MSIYVFFTVNYTTSCSFSNSKTVNLTVFYSKITLNVPWDLSQLFTAYTVVQKLSDNQLTVFHCNNGLLPLKSWLFFTMKL